MDEFAQEFFRGDYMPHGHCYLWQPGILWTNVLSDMTIALAYFSIPFALLMISKQRADFKFRGIFILFAAFILSCGITHLFSIYTIWNGSYGLHGITKAVTAVISAATAVVLFQNIKGILAIPTPSQLREAHEAAAEEKFKRTQIEESRKAESIFRFSVELMPQGVLVVDKDQRIRIANRHIEKLFGYNKYELNGLPLNTLITKDKHAHHDALVSGFVEQSEQHRQMASGRLVWGESKTGESIAVEINLSVHEHDGEKLTFASVTSVSGTLNKHQQFLERSNRLQRAIDATGAGIWEWNIMTNQIWYSPSLRKMVGQETVNDKLSFTDWTAHIHPDDKEKVENALKTHLAEGTRYDVIYRGQVDNSNYEWLRLKGDSLHDSQGKPILMSGTLMSVHELKMLELQLAENNNFLDAVLSQSMTGMFVYNIQDIEGSYLNEQFTLITGYDVFDLLQLQSQNQLHTIFHPDDIETLTRHTQNLLNNQTDKSESIEYRVKHKRKGHWVWCLSLNAVYQRNEDNTPKKILGTFVDISELKTREESIQKLALDFSTTFEQAAVGIAHVAPDGSWLKANEKLCDILGYSKKELLAIDFQSITFSDDLEEDEKQVKRMLNGEIDSFQLEKRYIHKQGHIIWAMLTVSLVKDERKQPLYFISVIEDISKRKVLEQELMESNRELEQFAYVASHDLKEPLRTIQTFSEYLIKDTEDGKMDRALQDKEFIDSACSRMKRRIDDLLKFSKVGNSELNIEKISLSNMVDEVLNDLGVRVEESHAELNIQKDLPTVEVDESLFKLVLQNLIQNALKFSSKSEPPIIDITGEVDSANSIYKLTIKDNGIGVDPVYQKQIFGLFKKLHTEDEYKGTGLGLAIVQKIMLRLNGSVSIDSAHGEGAAFTLWIPYRGEQ